MGSFIGHVVPGLALALLGAWHVVNTVKACCSKHSDGSTISFWYPFPRIKYLELISIFAFSILAIFTQLVDLPSLKFAFELDTFEHATMFVHLAIFSGFTLLAELNGSSEALLSGVLAASVFSQELFLVHFHSTDHVGLEGHYHWLLQLIVSVSLIFAILAVTCPTSPPVGLVLSASVMFQGLWFMNMGFVLWVPRCIPQGCFPTQEDTDEGSGVRSAVTCGSPAADTRARALANLQFSWILSGVLMFAGCVYLVCFRKSTPTSSEPAKYERLRGKGGDAHVAMYGFTKETP